LIIYKFLGTSKPKCLNRIDKLVYGYSRLNRIDKLVYGYSRLNRIDKLVYGYSRLNRIDKLALSILLRRE
jgi:hypothetical protein